LALSRDVHPLELPVGLEGSAPVTQTKDIVASELAAWYGANPQAVTIRSAELLL
jgi:hypothetical protein